MHPIFYYRGGDECAAEDNNPHVVGLPQATKQGTQYLVHPTVALLSKPEVRLKGLQEWVRGFGVDPDTSARVETWCLDIEEQEAADGSFIPGAERLIKAQGQLCYASFLGKFSTNAELPAYLDNINKSGHGSVTEAANYTFFFGGVSRSWSHEAVRHRAGMSPAQLSQRYVDGRALRFVMRPEYENTLEAAAFEARCDIYARWYEDLATRLVAKGIINTEGMWRTDARKAVNQVAREVLPNCTETAICITGNARAWRHFLNLRGSLHAEPEIRRTAWWVARILKDAYVAPHLFADVSLSSDWREGVQLAYNKP